MKHPAHGVGFVIHLRLVPEVLEGDDFSFIAFGSCGVLGKRGTADEPTNDQDKDAGHGLAPERMSDYRKPVSLELVAMEDRLSKVEVAK